VRSGAGATGAAGVVRIHAGAASAAAAVGGAKAIAGVCAAGVAGTVVATGVTTTGFGIGAGAATSGRGADAGKACPPAIAARPDNAVSVTDAKSLQRLGTIPVGERPFGIAVDREGRRAYTANVGSNDVSVIDIAENSEIGRVKTGLRPYAVALAQGRGFVTDQYDGTVSVFDLATLKPLKRITVGDYPEGIAATADGLRIIVANWESNSISVIDAVELKVTGETKVGDGPRAFGAFLRR